MKTPKTRREREIWRVCDELVTEGALGNKVTGDAIRERLFELGFSKGSPNEIYKYRKNWREARGIIDENFNEPALNLNQIALNDPIVRAIETVRNEIRIEAQTEIEKIRIDAEIQVKELQRKLEKAESELASLFEKNQSLTIENGQSKLDFQNIQTDFIEEKQLRIAFEQRAKTLEDSIKSLEQETSRLLEEFKNSHIEAKKDLNQRLKENEDKHHKEIDNLRDIHERQRHQWMVENDAHKIVNKNLEVKLTKAESKIEIDAQKNQELILSIKTLESKIESLKQERKNQYDIQQDLEHKLIISETEIKQIQVQFKTNQGLQLELQKGLQNKIRLIGQLEERILQLQTTKDKFKDEANLTHAEY